MRSRDTQKATVSRQSAALPEAAKNSRQCDTIPRKLAEGRQSVKYGAAEKGSEGSTNGTIRTHGRCSVEEKLKAVLDTKHVLLPWLVTHAGVIITSYKMVNDDKAASVRIKNTRPGNKMLPLGEKVVWMRPKD